MILIDKCLYTTFKNDRTTRFFVNKISAQYDQKMILTVIKDI